VARAGDIATLRRDIQIFTNVRIMVVKLDAAEREARGLPRTADVERYLAQLAAEIVDAADVVRQESFSARLEELMTKYMKQQLTSAQLIAKLVAMAKEVSADAQRGRQFDPPLNHAELAFYEGRHRAHDWPMRSRSISGRGGNLPQRADWHGA
jgi:type I restriction enzyme R subunit